jgi:hypothetical protein
MNNTCHWTRIKETTCQVKVDESNHGAMKFIYYPIRNPTFCGYYLATLEVFVIMIFYSMIFFMKHYVVVMKRRCLSLRLTRNLHKLVQSHMVINFILLLRLIGERYKFMTFWFVVDLFSKNIVTYSLRPVKNAILSLKKSHRVQS